MEGVKVDRRAVYLCVATGILLGTCLFLAARIIHPPPLEWIDVEFWDRLGSRVPSFGLEGLDGSWVSDQTFQGKGYVLFLGASGCGACDEVYPAVQEVARKLPVVMISTGDREELEAKVEKWGFSFPVAFDSLGGVARSLEVKGYPTVLYIDGEGRILKASSGVLYAERVIQWAEASVEESEE